MSPAVTAVESTGTEAFEYLLLLLVASAHGATFQRVDPGFDSQTLRLRYVDEHGADVQAMPQGMWAGGWRTVVGS